MLDNAKDVLTNIHLEIKFYTFNFVEDIFVKLILVTIKINLKLDRPDQPTLLIYSLENYNKHFI